MNTDRDKYLTEVMGYVNTSISISGHMFVSDGVNGGRFSYPRFSTADGFFKLWEWAKDQEWWSNFTLVNGLTYDLINPDHFANAVYSFLKGRE